MKRILPWILATVCCLLSSCAPSPDPCENVADEDYVALWQCRQPICWRDDPRIPVERTDEWMSQMDFCVIEDIPSCALSQGEWAGPPCKPGERP